MRGISLDEIVATTKIGRRLLRALEDEQFELLPGGIFNKAYVRAYAKCVGIDEEQAVAEYLEAAKETPPDTRVIAQQHASFHSDRLPESTGFPLMPVLILLVVVTGGIAGWKAYQDHQHESELRAAAVASGQRSQLSRTDAATTPSSSASPGAGTPSSISGSTGSSGPGSPSRTPASPSPAVSSAASTTKAEGTALTNSRSGTPFELVVRPKDRAWVSIKSDGNFVVRGIIKPPDVKTIHATEQVVFYTGNAGALEVSFNGKNVPLTGGPNTEQVLVFDSRGVMPQAAAQ